MTRKRLKIMLCLTVSFILLSACEKSDKNSQKNKSQNTSEMPKKLNEDQYSGDKILFNEVKEIPSYDSRIKDNGSLAKKNSNSYLVFSLEEFIDCYNANYYRDHGKNYIQPYSEWYSYIQDFGRYQDDMHYEFTADKKIWTLPTITAYTPQDETVIKELTVNFDDHSYTEKMYKKYEEMCFYTLKVFFPDMDEKEITKISKKLNKKAYDNIFQNKQGFHSDHPPSDLYYSNGVGVYPYFAYGESVRICIIPVTKKVIKSYQKKGVKIHKLKFSNL